MAEEEGGLIDCVFDEYFEGFDITSSIKNYLLYSLEMTTTPSFFNAKDTPNLIEK